MSAHVQTPLTDEQYLAMERAAIDARSEFYRGQMYAMSGASHRHGDITGNLVAELRMALRGRGCRVTPSDLRVRVEKNGLYAYPDVVVVCGKPEYADSVPDTLVNPTLVIEVLSPSRETYDRGFKMAQYRKLASLKEYALVAQERPHVEIYTRQSDGWLLTEAAGLDATCRFPSLECSVPMAEIYYMVEFEAPDLPPNGEMPR